MIRQTPGPEGGYVRARLSAVRYSIVYKPSLLFTAVPEVAKFCTVMRSAMK